MQRIINGILFEGKRLDYAFDVSVWEKNGHREISARQAVEWTEVCENPATVDYLGFSIACTPPTEAEIEERRISSLKKSAQRAQTMCRRIIKAEGFDELLTITYRENQIDRELAKKHFKEWVRRMKSALGGHFRYCASFEKQDRGAMHMHVACHRLPKHATHKGVKIDGWKLGTRIWRSIVGADNGLVFVGGKKGNFSHRSVKKSPAKMAQYVSKYIMKDFADCPESANRYSRSNGSDVPKPTHIRLSHLSMADAISLMFECRDGDVIVSHRLGHFKDSYWLCTEPKVATKFH